MEHTYLFVEHNVDVFIEVKEGDGIDHVIKTVNEVTRHLRQQNDTTQGNDGVTGPKSVGKSSSVCTGEEKVCPNKNDVVKNASVQTDWYEIDIQEGITVTTRSRSNSKERSLVSCAAMVVDPTVQESNAPRTTRQVARN